MRAYLRVGFLLLFVLMCGCSDAGNHAELSPSTQQFDASNTVSAESSTETQKNSPAREITAQETTRKLIKRARIQIQAADMETLDKTVTAAMQEHGAYSEQTTIYENYRTYIIRVPQQSYQPLLQTLKGMGKLISYSENVEDVTLRYFDLDGRLNTMRELRGTFKAYLKKAGTIEEILSVETRLAEVQRDIDRLGTELRFLSNQVDYASISFEIRGPAAARGYFGPTLGEKIRDLFSGYHAFVSTVILALIGAVIYGIPILVILVLLYWLLFGRIGLMKKLWRMVSKK